MIWKKIITHKNTHKKLNYFTISLYIPIISNAAVRCDVDGPDKPEIPKTAPPIAHAIPPNATTPIKARNGGPANHCPQHPFVDRSDVLKK